MPPDMFNVTSDSDLESVISGLDNAEVKKTRRRKSIGANYFCSINGGCGASFKRVDHLDRHEYHHTGVKKHVCLQEGCDKSYSILWHLKRHVRISHERSASEAQKKTIKCMAPGCDTMFSTLASMQRHVRELHEHPKEYECRHCDAKFTKKLKLRRHEIGQHTRDFPYKCEKCGRGFYQRWQELKHTPVCKVYPCSNCELKFEKWSLYLKHRREMQHDKKFHTCKHCERSYDKEIDLRKHVATKHAEGNTTNSESVTTFSCTEEGCNRNYAYERNLRQHILTAHGGRRFECTFENCDRCFSSSQNLVKHLTRDHNKNSKNDQLTEEDKLNEKSVSKKSKTMKKRKKRKDAGKSFSNLSRLTGLNVNRTLDNRLRERIPEALATVTQIAQFEEEEMSDVAVEVEHNDTIIGDMLNEVLMESKQVS